jgi:hypothetical protein
LITTIAIYVDLPSSESTIILLCTLSLEVVLDKVA